MTPPDATSPITERWSRANGGIERRATPREPVLLPALLIEEDVERSQVRSDLYRVAIVNCACKLQLAKGFVRDRF